MGNTKRRDTKGMVLRLGESQQKDGRYRYTYYINGKQHCFYIWKLEDTDSIPQRKHPCTALRSQIKWLNKSKETGDCIPWKRNKYIGAGREILRDSKCT